MRSTIILLIACACCALLSCKEHQPVAAGNSTAAVLTGQSIYLYDSVKAFLAARPEEDKEAQQLFLRAIDQYRNKKDAAGALDLFRKSITGHPTARAYYELGNALSDVKRYEEAVKAYRMAELLNYKPMSKLLYNTACALSLMDSTDKGLNYLEYAIEAGYSNADNIMKDKDLENLREDYRFTGMFNTAMGGSSDPDLVLWHSFKRGFAAAQFPLVLNQETVVLQTEENSISYEYEKYVSDMRDYKFSRDVGKEFYILANVSDNKNYTALVYAVRNTMMGNGAPLGFVLITFNDRGSLIDKMMVGGQKNLADPYQVCTIKENLAFEIKSYEIKYEKDPEKEGFENNKVVSNEYKSSRFYSINEAGKFVEQPQSLTLR